MENSVAIRRIQVHMRVHKIGEHVLIKEALDMAIDALREQSAMERLGIFGKLFFDYAGCPRGATGRTGLPLEEEVLQMPEIEDVDGCRWIPVNADALHDLVERYVQMPVQSQTPMTLDELREMDGPVWVSCKPIEGGYGYWCLCKNKKIITPAGSVYAVEEIPHWVFYHNKPKEEMP